MIQSGKTAKDLRTSLRGIANRAKKDGEAKFGNLYGLIDGNCLRECFYKLKRGAAPGVDGVTFEEYESEFGANLGNLVEGLKGKRYQRQAGAPEIHPETRRQAAPARDSGA